jgi:hypothetical protein
MGEFADVSLSGERKSFRGAPIVAKVPTWPMVDCPVCGKSCGGRGDYATQGVHDHMKYKHGIKRRTSRTELLEARGVQESSILI